MYVVYLYTLLGFVGYTNGFWSLSNCQGSVTFNQHLYKMI